MSKPIFTESRVCPTCGTTDTVALVDQSNEYPINIWAASVIWCKNGHVCVNDGTSGQEVYSFKGGI